MSIKLCSFSQVDSVTRYFNVLASFNVLVENMILALFNNLSPSFQTLRTKIEGFEAKKDQNIIFFSKVFIFIGIRKEGRKIFSLIAHLFNQV